MNHSFLYNFISPVTGRIWSERDYVPYGDKAGIAEPSPIIMDIRLALKKLERELEKIKPFPSDLSFIITDPDRRLPNAQALSNLSKGLMFNDKGTISTKKTIDTDELPKLGLTNYPTPLGNFIGEVCEGTALNRPKASSIVGEMFTDIEAINARFLTANFVMGDAITHKAWPKAQFLSS